MSERVIEKWECRVCAQDYPCIVEIHASDENLPDHLKGKGDRFRQRPCVCRERAPDWKPSGDNAGKQLSHGASVRT